VVRLAWWDRAWHTRLDQEIADLPFRKPAERRAIRRALARDPVAFAILYLSHHLRDSTGRITFSEVHYEWARLAEGWVADLEPQANRHAFIAPRETGKSTWWFLILPLWAAANRIVRFAVAFAHADAQATGHLSTFKRELDTNRLLAVDFPELADPNGRRLADRQGMLHTAGGFVFAARGVDSASLGLKVAEQRPDLLIFDDVEPPEADYSPRLAEKRLGTITDALLPLNIRARVVMVGTVTMPGSIMHQLVKSANGTLEPDEGKWIKDEKIQAHHHVPILIDPDGSERSMWPEKWPLDWLRSIRHTRSYAKNYLNDPMGMDGDFWTMEDFIYGPLDPPPTRWILQLDPAVTTKDKSDFTGWAVVAYSPVSRKCEVVAAGQIRLIGEPLRAWVLAKLQEFDRIRAVRVEVNQGGEMWYTTLHDLPVKLLVHTSTESKEVRFAYALDFYQRGGGLVHHRERIRVLEEQMVAFPKAPYDDVADAACSGILFFLKPDPVVVPGARSESYV
jgi:hypothetical protein